MGAESKRDEWLKMVKDNSFSNLTDKGQIAAAKAFHRNSEDGDYAKELRELVGSRAFAKLKEKDPDAQEKLLETIAEHPDPRFVKALEDMSPKELASLDEEGIKKLHGELGIN